MILQEECQPPLKICEGRRGDPVGNIVIEEECKPFVEIGHVGACTYLGLKAHLHLKPQLPLMLLFLFLFLLPLLLLPPSSLLSL
jgi:hypothetical protein